MISASSMHEAGHPKPVLWNNPERSGEEGGGRGLRMEGLLLLLSLLSRVQLCVTPQTAAQQAPLSLGFSRQEYWHGLPFPSPVHEMKSESEVAQSCLTLRLLVTPWTVAYQAPPSMGLSRQEYWSGVPLPSPLDNLAQPICQLNAAN